MPPENSLPPSGNDRNGSKSFGSDQGWPKWMIAVLLGIVALAFLPTLFRASDSDAIAYGTFVEQLGNNEVKTATFNNTNGAISAELNDGTKVSTNGPIQLPDEDA